MSAVTDKTIAIALLANWMKKPTGPDTAWPVEFENASRADFETAVGLAKANPDKGHIFKMAAMLMLNGFVAVAPDESNWVCDTFAESEILQAFDLLHEAEAV